MYGADQIRSCLPKTWNPQWSTVGLRLVWRSFTASGPGVVNFIDGTIDQHIYLNILKESLPLCLGENFYFTKITTLSIRLTMCVHGYFINNCPKVMDTPVHCPAINPIENQWSYLDSKNRNHTISSKDDLKRALQGEWGKIESNFCGKLVQSMPNRLKTVIKNKGMHTK